MCVAVVMDGAPLSRRPHENKLFSSNQSIAQGQVNKPSRQGSTLGVETYQVALAVAFVH